MKTSLSGQALIANGALVVAGSLMSCWSATRTVGLIVTAFMRVSLIYSGWTGICGWVPILARLPWNRSDSKAAESSGDVRHKQT